MRAIGHGTIVKYRSLSTGTAIPASRPHGAFKGGVTTLIQLQCRNGRWLAGCGLQGVAN
jgi:hypothetical protein